MKHPKSPFQPYERIGSTGGLPGGDPVRRAGLGPKVLLALAGLGLLVLLVRWWSAPKEEVHAEEPESNGSAMVLDAPQSNRPKSESEPKQEQPRSLPSESTPSPPAPVPVAKALKKPVERIVSKWMETARKVSKGKVHTGNTVVSIHVRDLQGRVWLARNEQEAVPPASNLKLLTTAAAVILAGAEAHFETRFEAAGPVRDGVLHGDLIARAGADPMLDPGQDGRLDRWMDPLAKQLRAAGIQKVNGRLVLDEGDYLEPGPGPAWPAENDYWQEYCALSGGFSANAGCMTSVVSATQVGQKAQVRVQPAGHGLTRSKGTVETVAKNQPLDVRVGAMPRLVVRGKLPAGKTRFTSRFAHPDPVDLFGHAVIEALQSRGIDIQSEPVRERHVPQGTQVAVLRTPILETFDPILLDSNNSVADQLYWWLGHTYGESGDRRGASRAVASALSRLGVDREGWLQVDGSGLSKNNRTRTEQITALLAGVLQTEGTAADAYVRALPIAGQTGSLRKRMRDGMAAGNVRAKTGFVNGTSALSGTVQTAKRETLVFSIIVHYRYVPGMANRAFKPMQDELCELWASWDKGFDS